MITVIDKKRMIRHRRTKQSTYIRNLRYRKRIQNGEQLISDEIGEKIISLIRGKTYPLSVKKIKHRMETELSIYDFNSHHIAQWLETKGEVNIGLIPLVRVLYPYSYEAIEDGFPIRSIFIVSKEVVQNNADCNMYSVDKNGRKVFLFGYRTYKTK